MPKLLIHGAKGRMGQAVRACALESGDWEIVGEIDLGDSLEEALPKAEVVVDFSAHDAVGPLCRACLQAKKPLVSGTTGLDTETRQLLQQAAQSIPIVWASNFSIGVNTLFWLVEHATRILGEGFDVEIVEMHHRHKKDAPSGTAKTLAEIIARVRNLTPEQFCYGRQGITGPRPAQQLGIHAVRGGDVVGEHWVFFAGSGEKLELVHRATSRQTFAAGALRAAAWILRQPPGLYDMQDVLGLRPQPS